MAEHNVLPPSCHGWLGRIELSTELRGEDTTPLDRCEHDSLEAPPHQQEAILFKVFLEAIYFQVNAFCLLHTQTRTVGGLELHRFSIHSHFFACTFYTFL